MFNILFMSTLLLIGDTPEVVLFENIREIQEDKFNEMVEVVSELKKEEIVSVKATSTPLPVCAPLTNIVTWMDYRANKMPNAPQTIIQRTGNVVTANDGTRWTNGRLHVAMAKMYGGIGDKLILNLGGEIIPALLVEWKGNTDCQHPDGSMLELVIDSTVGTDISYYQKRILSIEKEE